MPSSPDDDCDADGKSLPDEPADEDEAGDPAGIDDPDEVPLLEEGEELPGDDEEDEAVDELLLDDDDWVVDELELLLLELDWQAASRLTAAIMMTLR